MNKELIEYHETVFSKIKRLLKSFFLRKKEKTKVSEKEYKNNFIENLTLNEDEKRMKNLKKLYDNRELDEKNVTNEDVDKLIEMYDKEIEELRIDTKRRKNNIEKILKNYKN